MKHVALGSAGEQAAADYLQRRKMRLLARNWRPQGQANRVELDIVALEKNTLVFIEVKTRKPEDAARLTDNFTPRKRQNLLKAAQTYLAETQSWNMACRFDLICVELALNGTPKLEHYQNVIEFDLKNGRNALGGGHAAWQPW